MAAGGKFGAVTNLPRYFGVTVNGLVYEGFLLDTMVEEMTEKGLDETGTSGGLLNSQVLGILLIIND